MKLITNTDILNNYGDTVAVEMIKAAGFDAIDYSMFSMENDSSPLCKDNYREYVKELKEYADSLKISFLQGHAPFPSYRYNDKAYTQRIIPYIKRSIEISGLLGIKHLVIHPISPTQMEPDAELKEFNLDFYRSLLPLAKEYNVKICLENMWGYDNIRGYIIPNVCSFAKELADYVDALDSEYFVACLDLGHSGLIGERAEDAIRILGKDRLRALHVHDNDHHNDLHILPYYGEMNWKEILKALSDIGYEGNFTYEAATMLAKFPEDKAIYASTLKLMNDVGRYMIKQIKE